MIPCRFKEAREVMKKLAVLFPGKTVKSYLDDDLPKMEKEIFKALRQAN